MEGMGMDTTPNNNAGKGINPIEEMERDHPKNTIRRHMVDWRMNHFVKAVRSAGTLEVGMVGCTEGAPMGPLDGEVPIACCGGEISGETVRRW